MPEIHTSKIIQFIKTSPIKCCIEDFLKRLHKSDVDLDAKFYRLFLVGHSQPLDNEKTIGFYGLNNMVQFIRSNLIQTKNNNIN